jgi:hypothetical protein
MVLENFVPNAVIQILDAKDAVIASKQAQEKGTIFQYLKPGDYYARLFLDENGTENGIRETFPHTSSLKRFSIIRKK